MSERFVEAFVEKLILLEEKTGASVHYRIMPPFTDSLYDHLSIQKTARNIAQFIGLNGYTFIVAIAKQKEKVAGHIDLSTGGNTVFIEIDSEMLSFPSSVCATLCHEICHKWLQVNGICGSIEIENEILTDIASVFLGLGKIMLNGCHEMDVRRENIPNGTRTITETMKVGYLNRDQLAFVYCLVCAMRKIPKPNLMQGLNTDAANEVRRCNSLFQHYYAPHFHNREAFRVSADSFMSKVTNTQLTMAELDKHITYIRKVLGETIDLFIKTEHKKIEKLRSKAIAMTNKTTVDPALWFLWAIKVDREIHRLSKQLHSSSQEADELLSHSKRIGCYLYQNGRRFPAPSSIMFNTVTCPQDGTEISLQENSGDLTAICPICKYRFAYNTSTILFSKHARQQKLSFWQRFRKFMIGKKNDKQITTPDGNSAMLD